MNSSSNAQGHKSYQILGTITSDWAGNDEGTTQIGTGNDRNMNNDNDFDF